MIFFDTETCGFHGPTVLIQYAEDDGPIYMHDVWLEPISETQALIERLCASTVCGFNLTFDWFHVCQTYTVLALLGQRVGFDNRPIDHILDYAELEPLGRDGQCLKPVSACDLYLHALKGPYQKTMDRKDISVKRVPTALAWQLAEELDHRIQLNPIYFARSKSGGKWSVEDTKNSKGEDDPNFKNIKLRFKPSSALKALAVDALGVPPEEIIKYGQFDTSLAKPAEFGFAPFALAVGKAPAWSRSESLGSPKVKGHAWPVHIQNYVDHWQHNLVARTYAEKDVVYTRDLYKFFGSPEPGDTDSLLACMVGAVRWRGFKIDAERIKHLQENVVATAKAAPKAPNAVKAYLYEVLSDIEKVVVRSTKKSVLEEIAKWTDVASVGSETVHPAAVRAQECLNARKATKEIENYQKLLIAGRFHASFKILGALSGRMSGADKLNAQGIKKTTEVRQCFPLAWPGYSLSGGDFVSFEVSIAEAVYNDPQLRTDLLSGKKIHALFGMEMFPGKSYDEVVRSSGTANDMYTKGKSGFFAVIYGGNENTLENKLGIPLEVAQKALEGFGRKYKGVGKARQTIVDKFCAMKQPGGIGSKVEWHEPSDFIESLFGFRRYFTLENEICRNLFKLAEKPPKAWSKIKVSVKRRDRIQTANGAVQSALFGASFAIQSANMRAAGNHQIQSTGAEATKTLQCKVWDLQPSGIGEWIVQPMNIHDEIQCPTKEGYENQLHQVVIDYVNELTKVIPLVAIDWHEKMNSWADK